jgi:hypothetical protein
MDSLPERPQPEDYPDLTPAEARALGETLGRVLLATAEELAAKGVTLRKLHADLRRLEREQADEQAGAEAER